MQVCVGDVIEAEASDSVLRGHGTMLRGGSLVATRCGQVQRWNQLVLVEPLAGGYTAAVGHVVVGRVVQVEPSRWLVDVRARTLAVLPLSTAGGAVRKAAEGALDMRSILVEGDLIAAEVQSVRADGQVQLHVRDAVASKLPPGMVVSVAPTLIRPQRKHIHQCGSGLKVILGCNGMVWVGLEASGSAAPDQVQAAVQIAEAVRGAAKAGQPIMLATFQASAPR
ncbi:exosome complex component RRP4 [Micractinium conductrix]|uniref:Exosome complex component RRP4 n=1 Tax=Micractinium conductrix TaxID=554055 RepID=A0A2P6VL17_9CHLO|nr:exosome complex component RRP4 [Micractinium conductrix]|eukprot:PSC74791.1 exosome complex component RRP4 [Micractinium conductrix]